MTSLATFGRRQSARLQSLSFRQTVALGVLAVIGVGVAVASAAGHVAVATSLLAVLLAAATGGVLYVSRRIGVLHRANQASVRDLRVVVEQMQRRVVSAIEKERLVAGDRHRELSDAVARTDRLSPRNAELLLRDQTREIEAMVQLFQDVTPRAPMPPGGAAVNPSDLLGLLHIVRSRRPKLVVALGGAASTVWLAYALEKAGGRLVAVEHDEEDAERIRALLRAHGLSAVEVVHAPLTELPVDGETLDWYDVAALTGLRDIDLLLIEGPAPLTAAEAVPPALQVFGRRLARGAAVVVEDAARPAPRQTTPMLLPERRLAGRYTALEYGVTPAAGAAGVTVRAVDAPQRAGGGRPESQRTR
jgi:predicted O-methyltransferase YrrM